MSTVERLLLLNPEDQGCSIYERRPSVCRGFDCRKLFMSKTRNERRDWIKSGMMQREVYAAARERLKGGDP